VGGGDTGIGVVSVVVSTAGGAGDDRPDRSIASTSADLVLTAGGAGEERQDKSIESRAGDGFRIAMGCEESRSTLSTPGDADFVLRKRGDVRLLRIGGMCSFELF
jgi:hypothetical protein